MELGAGVRHDRVEVPAAVYGISGLRHCEALVKGPDRELVVGPGEVRDDEAASGAVVETTGSPWWLLSHGVPVFALANSASSVDDALRMPVLFSNTPNEVLTVWM